MAVTAGRGMSRPVRARTGRIWHGSLGGVCQARLGWVCLSWQSRLVGDCHELEWLASIGSQG